MNKNESCREKRTALCVIVVTSVLLTTFEQRLMTSLRSGFRSSFIRDSFSSVALIILVLFF